MKIAVINPSFPAYNLAAHRMRVKFKNEGHDVYYSPHVDMWSRRCEKAYISVIFTWDLPAAVRDINNLLESKVEVEIGGPAVTAIPQYIVSETGITPHLGLDPRFEHIPGKYQATFTSRGCPRDCGFCIVQLVEGRKMIEYDEYPIPTGKNPYVCDNNTLATSWGHQEEMVARFKHIRNLDLNSGFDDRIFIKDPEKYYNLYHQLRLEAWRFAYDNEEQRNAVKECADFLHTKKIVCAAPK